MGRTHREKTQDQTELVCSDTLQHRRGVILENILCFSTKKQKLLVKVISEATNSKINERWLSQVVMPQQRCVVPCEFCHVRMI